MEITSTGRSHELLFHRRGRATSHPQLMDRNSPSGALPSPGLAGEETKPVPGGGERGLITTQQWRKDWQIREERICNEKSRDARTYTVLRNRDVHRRASEGCREKFYTSALHLSRDTHFVVSEEEPGSFSLSFGRSSCRRCQEAVTCPGALTWDQGPVLQLAHCRTLQGWLRRGCWAKAMHSASSTTPCGLWPSNATQYTERVWVPPPQVAEQDPHSPVFQLQVTESSTKKKKK